MMSKSQGSSAQLGTGVGTASASIVRALAVGDPQEWQQQGHALPTQGLAFVAFHEVTQETLDYLRPNTVFSPLLAKGFDCVDLAVQLHRLGYSGEYLALAVGLPKPDVIEREVRQLCPQLKFRIVEAV